MTRYPLVFSLLAFNIGLPAVTSAQEDAQLAKPTKPAYFQMVTYADGAQFVIRLHNRKQIHAARDIIAGKERDEVHVAGAIVKAPATYNRGWSFHLDPDSVEFFGAAAEACDAATVMVEKDLNDVGGAFLPGSRWCPWSSRLVAELRSPEDPVLTIVSAASLSEVAVSPTSLASAMGENLTRTTEAAEGGELPTKLAGVQVEFRGTRSSERWKAPLLLASPERINFLVPSDLRTGTYTIRLIRDNQTDLETATRVESVAPGILFGEKDGDRYAAATLLRVRADGSRADETLLSVDASGNFVPVPVKFESADDRLYLSLYGTGVGTSKVTVRIGSTNVPVLYSGPQGSMQGLDQINVEVPRTLASRSEAEIRISSRNQAGHMFQSAPVKLLFSSK